jgi:2-methylcitrate dehydratase
VVEFSVTDKVARFVVETNFEDLPGEVVEKAKKVLIDTIGVAVAAWTSPPSKMIRRLVEEVGGRPESTIIGSGTKVPCQNAVLANGVMVRYLDFLDNGCATGHPSELIPTILAVGERERSLGEEVLAAIVIGYELHTRFMAQIPAGPGP